MSWVHRLRLRALMVLIGSLLGAAAVIGWMSAPALPALGVALITAAAVVNKMAARAGEAPCAGCGRDLAGSASSNYGAICPACGTINQQHDAARLAARPRLPGPHA